MTKVLIMEDEALIAMDLCDCAEHVGAIVIGPHSAVHDGLDIVAREMPDLAILDVNLLDGDVFQLADKLNEAGVPIVFHSGHVTTDVIASRYPNALFCPKPCAAETVISRAMTLIGK